MLTPEQIARLTPEELVIAEKWEREKEVRSVIFYQWIEAESVGDKEKAKELLKKLCDVPAMCEHGRSIASPCIACHRIEMKLYPELFDEDGNRIDDY